MENTIDRVKILKKKKKSRDLLTWMYNDKVGVI